MRNLALSLSALLLVTCTVMEFPVTTPADAVVAERIPPLPDLGWAPPTWFPDEQADELWVLDQLDQPPLHRRGPQVRASSAVIADLESGEVLWAKDPDSPRSIASLTKLVSSLALASTEADLDKQVCVTHEQWPSRPGARSKFETGDCPTGWELLGAALVASDNRGAFSLPALADEDFYVFVRRMKWVARDLGMRVATFSDPAGIEDDNMASARDVLKAVTAVAFHPTLQPVASAPSWRIDTNRGPRLLGSTNRLLALSVLPEKMVRTRRGLVPFTPPPYETIAAKTGYTDTAHYCFATVVRSTRTGKLLAAALLNSHTNSSRFDDMDAMLDWADHL